MFIQHPQPTDASHGVFAPGGYEWWHFDAEDEGRGLYMTVEFFDGWPFHAIYRERYGRFLRNPTRCAPPIASEHPYVFLHLYERERLVGAVCTAFPPGSLNAASGALDVRVGDNSVVRDEDRIRLNVAGMARGGTPLRAYLHFHPVAASQAKEFDLTGSSRGKHRWVLVDPVLEVEGQVHLGREGEMIPLRGRGYHDHFYGTGDLASAAWGQVRGRALTEAGFIAFVIPTRPGAGLRQCVVDARGGQIEDLGSGPAALGRADSEVPQSIRIGELELDEPENMGVGPHGLRIAYRRGDVRAFCDFVDPVSAAGMLRT
jgi:hypothetical protein